MKNINQFQRLVIIKKSLKNGKIAILAISTNEEKILPILLQSLLLQTNQNFTIFLLSNNCVDSSVKVTKSFFSDAQVLISDINLGFAAGINLLARHANDLNYEYIFITNPDIELAPNCLEELIQLIDSDQDLIAVAPIMYYGLEKRSHNIIQSYVDVIDFNTRSIKSIHVNQKFDDSLHKKVYDVGIVSGGITFARTQFFLRVGMFDERYFIYGEEADFAMRARIHGYKMKVTSNAVVWHHHDFSKSNQSKHAFQYYYQSRAKVLFFRKYNMLIPLLRFLVAEFFLFPVKTIWANKKVGLNVLWYYYLGIIYGMFGESGRSKRKFD